MPLGYRDELPNTFFYSLICKKYKKNVNTNLFVKYIDIN